MTVKLVLLMVRLMILISLVQNKLILKQVVILNRHSLRAPLSDYLKDVSPKAWPQWSTETGLLTVKGAKLAGYMGGYVAAWLRNEGVLPANCPSEDDLQVFSNTLKRTLTSAQSFVEKGFPSCQINVRHSGANVPNPLFIPIIHNTSATFKEHALNEIHEVLDNLQLNEAYELLTQILEYKQSRSCKMNKKCNLVKGKNHISIIPGLKPGLNGPLKVGHDVIDAFLMQNYEGYPTEDVAWGQLNNTNSWKTLFEINNAYFSATYNTRLIARDISGPLINHMSQIFLKDDNKPNVTILFGHDVNIYTVFKTLSVRPYCLEQQVEVIPIGTVAVFQKWIDDEYQKEYFKLSIIYQTTEQLRSCNILSLESPPQTKTLELEKCTVDINGFCPWSNFETILENL